MVLTRFHGDFRYRGIPCRLWSPWPVEVPKESGVDVLRGWPLPRLQDHRTESASAQQQRPIVLRYGGEKCALRSKFVKTPCSCTNTRHMLMATERCNGGANRPGSVVWPIGISVPCIPRARGNHTPTFMYIEVCMQPCLTWPGRQSSSPSLASSTERLEVPHW